MRNIWTIFTRDIRKIRTNVIALIVVLASQWFPAFMHGSTLRQAGIYGNTRNLKVAVASVDEGYTGNLIPLQLNLGDQVLSALRGEYTAQLGIYDQKQSNEGCKIRRILRSNRNPGRFQYEPDECIFQ